MSMNNTTVNSCNQSQNHFQLQPPSSFDIFTGIIMILIIVTSLAGNILICYAFMSTSRLRVVTNYFIMNLALSDILTASFVITFDADMKIHGLSSWRYGLVMCKIWTTTYTVSVPTSILTLCVVSVDRYQAISNPLGYRAGITLNTRKALCLIGGIWALSLFMAFLPLIAGSPLNNTLSRDLPRNCPDVTFCYFDIAPSYTAVVTIIAFILPSVVMGTLYVKMYLIITYGRYISDDTRTGCNTGACRMANNVGNKTERNMPKNDQEESKNKAGKTGNDKQGSSDIQEVNNDESRTGSDAAGSNLNLHTTTHRTQYQTKENKDQNKNTRNKTRLNKNGSPSHQNANKNSSKRSGSNTTGSNINSYARPHRAVYQAKVAKHFSVIVLVQLLCWYPFSVASLVYNLCDDCEHISSSVQYFLLTIGYMSCAINPYLYAYQQRSFRQVFSRMLGKKL